MPQIPHKTTKTRRQRETRTVYTRGQRNTVENNQGVGATTTQVKKKKTQGNRKVQKTGIGSEKKENTREDQTIKVKQGIQKQHTSTFPISQGLGQPL